MPTKPPTIVHYVYRPKRAPKKKASQPAIPTRIVTIPSKRARQPVERPEAEAHPEPAPETPRIVSHGSRGADLPTGPTCRRRNTSGGAMLPKRYSENSCAECERNDINRTTLAILRRL